MGSVLSYFIKPKRILVLGSVNSGKTTILNELSDFKKQKPKIMKNKHFYYVKFKNYIFLELEEGIDPVTTWELYYDGISSIIFVFDASNPIKSEKLLSNLFYKKELRKIPLLVIINKIQNNNAFIENYLLNIAKRRFIYYIKIEMNKPPVHLKDGFDWLIKNI